MDTTVRTYRLTSLWRYPVKSMAGEELDDVAVTSRGLSGDRAYALIDTSTGKVGSAKNARRYGELLKCRVQFLAPPEPDAPVPPVRITFPDGRTLLSTQSNIDVELAADFGLHVSLVSRAPKGLMLEFAAGTLGGQHAATTELPVSSGAPEGTLFNYASVHLVSTSTLRMLQSAYPAGQFALDRFRPNLVVDCGDEDGFPENTWPGRTLAIGPNLLLRVTIPCPRCVVPTLPRTDLPLDPGILRTVADRNTVNLGDFGDLPCVGVYADVVQPGRIRRGDAVRILEASES